MDLYKFISYFVYPILCYLSLSLFKPWSLGAFSGWHLGPSDMLPYFVVLQDASD